MSHATNGTEVLIAAKWILENVGWVQDTYGKFEASGKPLGFCAEGAIRSVDVGNNFGAKSDAYRRLSVAVKGSIVGFNDNKKTTKKKVLSAFDRAIKERK